MTQTLSEALHARLDELGAPPREAQPQPEISDETEGQIVEPDDGAPLEAEVEASETETVAEGHEAGEVEDIGEAETEDQETVQAADGQTYKVKDLAEAIGWEAEDLYKDLVVPLGNGESLTLGELKNTHETVAQQQAELKQAWEQVQQQHAQLQQFQQQLVQGQQAQSEELENARGEVRAIEAQFSNVDWTKIEEDNPGQAANLRQKFAVAYAQAKSKTEEAEKKAAQVQQEAMQRMIVEHDQRLMQMVPEWQDMKNFQTEMPQIQEYLVSRGFQPQELQTIYHAGARAVARDAWLWNQHKAQVEQAKGKVRKAPKKVIRSGKHTPQRQIAQKRVEQLEQQAIRSQNPNDKLAAARAIFESSRQR